MGSYLLKERDELLSLAGRRKKNPKTDQDRPDEKRPAEKKKKSSPGSAKPKLRGKSLTALSKGKGPKKTKKP